MKSKMAEKKISIRQLAEATAIPATTLYRRLTIGESFQAKELEAIAKILGLQVSDLWAEAEEKTAA